MTIRSVLMSMAVAATFLLTTGAVSAGTITDSAHDFSSTGWSSGRICVACHAPHHTDTATADAPLWNHELTTATYTLYDTPTTDATITSPGGLSKLCLSCHDGTVAIDSFGGTTGGTAPLNDDSSVGIDLSNDHPIGFLYNGALVDADGALHDPTTANVTIGTIGGQEKTGTIQEILLYDDKMECSSCHDVHNTFTVTNAAPDTDMLLKITQQDSALCLTCHDK